MGPAVGTDVGAGAAGLGFLGNWQKIKYQFNNQKANADSATLSSTYETGLPYDGQ